MKVINIKKIIKQEIRERKKKKHIHKYLNREKGMDRISFKHQYN